MEELLTRDAEKLLAMIYKRYLEVRRSGQTREEAKYFGSSAELIETLSLKDLPEDVDDYCRELAQHAYLHILNAEDTVSEVVLANVGIAKLERRFSDGIKSVLDFLTKFL